ncbi:hypothetical protein L6452_17789 [Arctium lappa]|uniref:Uncharacterized protein n=1 Tax=Arctium lappa TaxID=4217 RepID=A0ACB9C4D7_ARCLA|nr:hypothetical protein L6452_17789 [Arctium lappa]
MEQQQEEPIKFIRCTSPKDEDDTLDERGVVKRLKERSAVEGHRLNLGNCSPESSHPITDLKEMEHDEKSHHHRRFCHCLIPPLPEPPQPPPPEPPPTRSDRDEDPRVPSVMKTHEFLRDLGL